MTKSFAGAGGRVEVLRGVSLTVARGESVALTGESGSGKSTLLHILGCLESPDSGVLRLGGRDLSALDEAGRAEIRRHRIAVVFQSLNLIPSLTAGQNLVFQARLAGRHDPAQAARLADRLGLADLLHRYPEQLSGGQQQRVAIGRALAGRPDMVLADEPTGNLDEASAARVLELFRDLAAETGAGFLMVTHSERHAATLDRRLHLAGGRLA